MSDQQPPVQPQHSLEDANEGPPVKRTCMNDTPPIALTPADDGSDFYNTPWVVRTPAEPSENSGVAIQGQTNEPATTSHPSTVIPGLNLVNDSLKDLQPVQSDPSPSPNPTTQEGAHTDTQNDMDVEETEPKKQEPTVESVRNVEGEQNSEPRNQVEAANHVQTDDNRTNGDASGTGTVPPPDAMEHDQAERDEEDEEHPEWEIDSSPYESSSDDSSSDSSDDSDEDDEDYPILSPEEQARILMQAELGSDDEGEGKGKSGGHIRTANELPEEAPPIPEVTVTPEMKIVLLGHVEAIVENTVLIAANTSGEYQVLESSSLLCLEDRSLVGVVAETLGRVENPLYTIRFPTAAAVEERGLCKGKNVYYVEQHSTFVFTQPLKGMKGSDASNFHDEEIGEDEVEFSDDEAEAEYKRKLKQKRQERKEARDGPAKAKKGPPGPSKLSQTELNYDDNAGEDGYTPLARPKNFHEMMGRQEAPVENDGPTGRGGFRGGRGRGRGFDRGRGGRGRGGGPRDTQHYDRQPYQQQGSDAQPQASNYTQQAYQQTQPNAYGMPQPYPAYPSFPQQQQQQQPQHQPQQQLGQGAVPPGFNFQMPFQQAYPQQNPYQFPPNMQINPLFLAALQQQQQYQQQQAPGQQPAQAATMNFDQVKAQLDLLRQLSNNNQGPPRS
ncbi:Gar1/Naf1 RNA binding region-domain-containing protein [Aspergillus pseudotamarii]|uniref:H/ACA ribonucleoprotein complex non-core subunit NAF1 n=1 Tax=Aspergillus pseudotamarii TaxID=132259 RepID=A0A5N6TAQ2_ASPPS|nr:Gar1/Naf1 RNA binding region-domain-containing protein [Aspergillus pseudotamarii]KAE8143347.1 Gar1/Naf1 RNA binding region-domain-containing protein [Aspergillus pseudotamarii]